MRGYQNDVYRTNKTNNTNTPHRSNRQPKNDFFVEKLFAMGNTRFIREPFEFSTAKTISPFSLLEAYYNKCLNTRPFIKSSKRIVLLKPKATPEAPFTAVNLYRFCLNYKGVIIGTSESVDKHGVADKTAFQVIKKYISPLYEKIKPIYKEIDELSQYIITENPGKSNINCAINLSCEKKENSTTSGHKNAVLSERNFKEYMEQVRNRILETEGLLSELIKLDVPEKFNAIMGRFMKIPTKIFFDIPGVKDELGVFMKNDDFKILYKSRFTSKKATSTTAMVVVNYDRFMNVPEKEYSKAMKDGQISFLSYEVGVSKKEAKSRAIATLLLNTIPELIPEDATNYEAETETTEKNNVEIKAEINNRIEYEKLAICDLDILTVENGFRTNVYEHKNPMALLNEIFSKLYKSSLNSLATFEKLESTLSGTNMELTYKTHTFQASGRTKKITENTLCLLLIKKMFPNVEYYYKLVTASKDNTQLNKIVDVPFISESSEVSLNYIQNLVRNELGKKNPYTGMGKKKKEVLAWSGYKYIKKNTMNWILNN
eukprot:GAHX01002571.1.p1 GENE.GAHX01002571.1~~GAHX01002571.1.p1  ORF type:complete len:544 (+),score=112.39 GAHX01002571.1:36-1667(+)